jgi:hypothetical protein
LAISSYRTAGTSPAEPSFQRKIRFFPPLRAREKESCMFTGPVARRAARERRLRAVAPRAPSPDPILVEVPDLAAGGDHGVDVPRRIGLEGEHREAVAGAGHRGDDDLAGPRLAVADVIGHAVLVDVAERD